MIFISSHTNSLSIAPCFTNLYTVCVCVKYMHMVVGLVHTPDHNWSQLAQVRNLGLIHTLNMHVQQGWLVSVKYVILLYIALVFDVQLIQHELYWQIK